MFERVGNYFVVTVDSIVKLEELSRWICLDLGKTYFIEVSKFPNMTLYHTYIKMDKIMDEHVSIKLKELLNLTKKGED